MFIRLERRYLDPIYFVTFTPFGMMYQVSDEIMDNYERKLNEFLVASKELENNMKKHIDSK